MSGPQVSSSISVKGVVMESSTPVMTDFVEQIYLREIIQQCEWAAGAFRRMETVLKVAPPHVSEFFREASSFLQHTAAVSKMLWPGGEKDPARSERAQRRGAHLRRSLGVEGHHPLKSRRLRDHIEHLDTRLDDWAESSTVLVDNFIGPRRSIGGNAVKESDILRNFDPDTGAYIVRGERFDIHALLRSVGSVHERALTRRGVLDGQFGATS